MDFKILINNYAKLLNVPLNYIVQDSLLEEIVKDKTDFLLNPFQKGFHKDVLNQVQFKRQFLAIVHSIDRGKGWENPARERSSKSDTLNDETDRKLINKDFAAFKAYTISRYGEVAGESLLRGLSKRFSDEAVEWEGTRQYQRDLYSDFLASL